MVYWPSDVERRSRQHIREGQDSWIFKYRKDGTYFAVGTIDSIGVQTILMCAELVEFTSQRATSIEFIAGRGYRR